MNWEDYNRLKLLADKDLEINQDNVLEKSLKSPYVYHKYLDVFINETRIYKTLESNRLEMYSKLYKKYKYENDHQADSKAEVEVFINSDNEYLLLKHKTDMQQTILTYLELLLDCIGKTMGYGIKNFIDFKKFLSGN